MSTLVTNSSSSTDSTCDDCSPFLNWDEEEHESDQEKAVVFRSLVATLKLQPSLDDYLVARAMKLLDYVVPSDRQSADTFIGAFGPITDDSSPDFVHSIGMFFSSTNQVITATAMKMLHRLILYWSSKVHYTLVKVGLITQIINTLKQLSLSFTEAEDFHSNLIYTIYRSLRFTTPFFLRQLKIKDRNGQQAVYETILKQVLIPSERYICHLCVNRFSIVDGDQSKHFMDLLALLLRISPCYQPTMEFVLHMPVFLTIPSCHTFFEGDEAIWTFLDNINISQREWNETRGLVRQNWKTVHRMLRMEGIEDVNEKRLQNHKTGYGGYIVYSSIGWNSLHGMNLPRL
ncbi:hypothetical protein BLNAU_7403 [Blattamonas nauphoetae]|uniref:Uncharacterized protein n=1 Tax=Blattamonas nauphoetae TaxID=2049346 RepID=A0ABQ9Y1G7_9EUKA|nr:hypothetical protein BLNAU_7403 [Blattamonas nauphoetae]